MDEKALKKILKPLIRECIAELFVEMNLQTIVENAVKKTTTNPVQATKKTTSNPMSIKEVYRPEAEEELSPGPAIRNMKPSSDEKRKIIMEKIGAMDNSMWKDIYADTATRGSPILEGDAAAANPNEVSEDQLARLGLMKDYSKHIGMDAKSQEGDDEWKTLREQRRKILESTIKRTG